MVLARLAERFKAQNYRTQGGDADGRGYLSTGRGGRKTRSSKSLLWEKEVCLT